MKKRILLGIALFMLLLTAFIAWQIFGPTIKPPQGKYLYVRTGATFEELVKQLEEDTIVRNGSWFRRASKLIGYTQVRPGKYEITKGMSVADLVRMLRNGRQTPVSFVVTKIRTREVLASRIGKAFECDSLEMIRFLNSPDSLNAYGLDTNTAMAAVMPLTYTLRWNSTARKVFEQFHTAWKKFWTEERRRKADSLGLSITQVSTLASIIDEETNAPSDRPNIASVYLNRIAKGMPLQADPTVKFALREFGLRRIYQAHTRFESPYNTYTTKGLPPGPICTPAEATIDAVLNAPKTEYLYFVASPKFDGTHVFTTNYKDHLKEARIYQQELNKRNVK